MLKLTKKETVLYQGLVEALNVAAGVHDSLESELDSADDAASKSARLSGDDIPEDREELSLFLEDIRELWMDNKIGEWQDYLESLKAKFDLHLTEDDN